MVQVPEEERIAPTTRCHRSFVAHIFFSKHCQTSPGFSWPDFHRIFSPLRLFSALRTLEATGEGPGVWCRRIRDDFGIQLSAGDGKLEFGVDCSVCNVRAGCVAGEPPRRHARGQGSGALGIYHRNPGLFRKFFVLGCVLLYF